MTLKHNLSTIAKDIDDITVSMSERLAKATNDISALIEELEQLKQSQKDFVTKLHISEPQYSKIWGSIDLIDEVLGL